MKKNILFAAIACSLIIQPLAAQDVVEAGRAHGTQLPQWMARELAADPNAFEFERAWKPDVAAARAARARLQAQGTDLHQLSRQQAAQQGAAVTGTFRVPVLPVRYSDTAEEPYDPGVMQAKLYSGPSETITLTELYTQMSGGMVTLTGNVYPWAQVSKPGSYYEGDDNGGAPELGHLLKETLDALDPVIDFSQYDVNGDGYVDFAAFMHPTFGGECGDNSHIWSHRWTYRGATGGAEPYYQTADGVRVSDYVIQPAYNCPGAGDPTPIDIGVWAHEYGHGFSVPDLYSTDGSNSGIGVWGLMGSGTWNRPASPAHMIAWSKADLGWVEVVTVASDTTVVLEPVQSSHRVLRLAIPPAEGSTTATGEYFLLENRQRLGSDVHLMGPGLLIWHVDSATVATRRVTNTVQNATLRKGVDLEEADGLNGLDDVNYRGGAGDVWPGSSGALRFGADTQPNSQSNVGYASGVEISAIAQGLDGSVSLRIAFGDPGPMVAYWGDVNGDGYIGEDDALVLLNVALGKDPTVDHMSRGDVDADDQLTYRDALIIQSYAAGVDVSQFRVGQEIDGTTATLAPRSPSTPPAAPAVGTIRLEVRR